MELRAGAQRPEFHPWDPKEKMFLSIKLVDGYVDLLPQHFYPTNIGYLVYT